MRRVGRPAPARQLSQARRASLRVRARRSTCPRSSSGWGPLPAVTGTPRPDRARGTTSGCRRTVLLADGVVGPGGAGRLQPAAPLRLPARPLGSHQPAGLRGRRHLVVLSRRRRRHATSSGPAAFGHRARERAARRARAGAALGAGTPTVHGCSPRGRRPPRCSSPARSAGQQPLELARSSGSSRRRAARAALLGGERPLVEPHLGRARAVLEVEHGKRLPVVRRRRVPHERSAPAAPEARPRERCR